MTIEGSWGVDIGSHQRGDPCRHQDRTGKIIESM